MSRSRGALPAPGLAPPPGRRSQSRRPSHASSAQNHRRTRARSHGQPRPATSTPVESTTTPTPHRAPSTPPSAATAPRRPPLIGRRPRHRPLKQRGDSYTLPTRGREPRPAGQMTTPSSSTRMKALASGSSKRRRTVSARTRSVSSCRAPRRQVPLPVSKLILPPLALEELLAPPVRVAEERLMSLTPGLGPQLRQHSTNTALKPQSTDASRRAS